MKLAKIYIISWFGKDPEGRKFRKNVHLKQLEWCKKNNLAVTVLAQEYDLTDYQPDVEYVHSETFLRPCGARNALLEIFYNSDEDFAIFADNDTIVGDHFIEEMRHLPTKSMDQIDFVGGINPAIQAYTAELEKPDYKNNAVFCRTNRFSGGFFILKNLNKLKNLKMWFDDAGFTDSNNNLIPGEESDFCINLLMNGLKCFQNYKAVFIDMATAQNSTWAHTTSERTNKVDLVKFINAKHNLDLITLLNEQEKKFNHVGYSMKKDKLDIRFCVDKDDRIKVLQKNHTNIVFYDLPYAMTIDEIIQWVPQNITDLTLLELVNKNKKKSFRRLGNPRTRFNWQYLNHQHPVRLLIPLATESHAREAGGAINSSKK